MPSIFGHIKSNLPKQRFLYETWDILTPSSSGKWRLIFLHNCIYIYTYLYTYINTHDWIGIYNHIPGGHSYWADQHPNTLHPGHYARPGIQLEIQCGFLMCCRRQQMRDTLVKFIAAIQSPNPSGNPVVQPVDTGNKSAVYDSYRSIVDSLCGTLEAFDEIARFPATLSSDVGDLVPPPNGYYLVWRCLSPWMVSIYSHSR